MNPDILVLTLFALVTTFHGKWLFFTICRNGSNIHLYKSLYFAKLQLYDITNLIYVKFCFLISKFTNYLIDYFQLFISHYNISVRLPHVQTDIQTKMLLLGHRKWPHGTNLSSCSAPDEADFPSVFVNTSTFAFLYTHLTLVNLWHFHVFRKNCICVCTNLMITTIACLCLQ